MRTAILAASLALAVAVSPIASAQKPDPGREAFRAIYKEMVEIDSSEATGSCTKVVRAIEARLKTAGFKDAAQSGNSYDVVIPEGKPDDGNIVARIRSVKATKKPILLLAHIDVVDANRADWERDPFKL